MTNNSEGVESPSQADESNNQLFTDQSTIQNDNLEYQTAEQSTDETSTQSTEHSSEGFVTNDTLTDPKVAESTHQSDMNSNTQSKDKWDYPSLMLKYVDLQAECAFHKARFDRALNRAIQEKDQEIDDLISRFEQLTQKRKQAFDQMKDKLNQSVTLINQYVQEIKEDRQTIAQLRSHISKQQNDIDTLRSQQSTNQTNYQQSTKQDLLLIDTLRSEATALHSNLASSQLEISELKAQVEELRSHQLHNSSFNQSNSQSVTQSNNQACSEGCAIRIQSSQGTASNRLDEPRLLPNVIETGHRLAFKWSLSGKVTLQWFRSFCGSQWRPVSGVNATKPSYVATVDDVGACLRAEATHLSDGQVVYAECGPVYPSLHMLQGLNDPLKKFEATFVVESAGLSDGGDKARKIVLHKDKVKLQDAKGRTTMKLEWNESVRARIDEANNLGFSIKLDRTGPMFKYIATDSKQRDLIVCSIRMFNYIITTQQGKLSKDNDHLLALGAQVRAFNERINVQPLSTVARNERAITSTPLNGPSAAPVSIVSKRTPRLHARNVSFSENIDWQLAASPVTTSRSNNQSNNQSIDPLALINNTTDEITEGKTKKNLRVNI